jgi:hypothetical protein
LNFIFASDDERFQELIEIMEKHKKKLLFDR